jgi:hypothetical protein
MGNNEIRTIRDVVPDEISSMPSHKQWRQPELRKLPIAATAQGKGSGNGDDGQCVGKGDVNVPCFS